MNYEAYAVCLPRDGVRELFMIRFKIHECLADLASTLLVIPIRPGGLEYRNTVRFRNQRLGQVNK